MQSLVRQLYDSSSNSRQWWNIINKITNTEKNDVTLPPLKSDDLDLYIENDTAKASLFNTYFLSQQDIDDTSSSLPIAHDPDYCLSDIIIDETDVIDVLSSLNTNKATGPDLINPILLRNASRELAPLFTKLFNLSIQTSTFPASWKLANVSPIFKKDDPSLVKNYRPISLLSIIGKVMERCVFKHLYNYLHSHSILTNLQSGFRPNDSTINQLLDLSNEFGRALDEGKEIRVVFCDISKAFDRVWHEGLIHKLRSIGIKDKILNWFANYLSNRKQRVVINGVASDWGEINAGVPQGSILGPILFLVYINDIVCEISTNIRLFADDTSLYIIVDNPIDSAELLNNDLDKIHTWSRQWLVDFNPNKTESLLISTKRYTPFHPSLYMNDELINEVEQHKHLGITFTHNLNWDIHIDEIVNKASKKLNMLRKLKLNLDRLTLQKIYFTFIPPSYFNSGTRMGQIYHCRLRTESSGLRAHLFARNISTTANCDCGALETTRHYLLHCPLYDTIRSLTIDTLQNKSLELLLFGNILLPYQDNVNIFSVVQDFILQSKRFSN
ncbi:hypothetical protein FSP39_013615 [Pinctada imbricata]|uniref:Reverse transcriptase domain-containing protein n=1 Tax=Pinctada imbricata TaxID=66713 RepID=A0AA88Y3N8_PINIB|nr:hypothetical protein FSP39_013615 [Pinctada imbricata]